MYKNDRVTRRYSEPFKLKILSELSTGKYSKYELGKLYGIAPSTINEWIRKYERKDLMNTRVMVETKDEITRIKALHKEIEQLKKWRTNRGGYNKLTVAINGGGYNSQIVLKRTSFNAEN